MSKIMSETPDQETNASSRRSFLAKAGLATAGVLGASKLVGMGSPLSAIDFGDQALAAIDIDVLNFALNLEYLEAEYYLRAVSGSGLSDSDVGGTGTAGDVTGGSAVPFESSVIRQYAEEIAADEEAHVKFLRTALGSDAVARPEIDLDQSFTTAARAAGLIGAGEEFNPFADETSFLLGAFIFEDVGVTAYKGAARLIKNKGVLEAAAGILAVEAYHAGEIRTVLYSKGLVAPARAISDLRDAADGAGDRDQGIRLQGKANIIPADSNGIAYSRTTAQVLNIVYLGGAAANFGFFPHRLNGNIR
jgi:Ferritin-like domain